MGRPPSRNKGAFSAAVPKAKHQVEHVFWLARQVGKPEHPALAGGTRKRHRKSRKLSTMT
jgi:hypothetical protein